MVVSERWIEYRMIGVSRMDLEALNGVPSQKIMNTEVPSIHE